MGVRRDVLYEGPRWSLLDSSSSRTLKGVWTWPDLWSVVSWVTRQGSPPGSCRGLRKVPWPWLALANPGALPCSALQLRRGQAGFLRSSAAQLVCPVETDPSGSCSGGCWGPGGPGCREPPLLLEEQRETFPRLLRGAGGWAPAGAGGRAGPPLSPHTSLTEHQPAQTRSGRPGGAMARALPKHGAPVPGVGEGCGGGGPAENNQDGEVPRRPAILPQPGPAGPHVLRSGRLAPLPPSWGRWVDSRAPIRRAAVAAGLQAPISPPRWDPTVPFLLQVPFLPAPPPRPISPAPSPGLRLSGLSQPAPHDLDPSCHVVGSPRLPLSRDCRVRTGNSPWGRVWGSGQRHPPAGSAQEEPHTLCPQLFTCKMGTVPAGGEGAKVWVKRESRVMGPPSAPESAGRRCPAVC